MSFKTGDTSAPASGFFVDAKKGEVNELKQLLKNINVERDVKRKREILKKVIACMTMGIDVSRLFTEMIMAIESKDIVVKKMVYLYLCNYAHKEPEMAIMCINSLRRECDNEDPLVRGLALRSICNLRLESILEYVEEPLRKSLVDLSSYVRKIGVMAVLKLYRLRPTFITDSSSGYMLQLQGLLQDPDATVIANVLYVLNELQLHYGGLEISQQTVMHLLSRIGEFSEWGLCAVLDILSRYSPQNDDEVFAIMNLLDPVLKTANSGAVLGTVKCFMKLANSMSSQAEDTDMLMQVWARSKPPLLTLVAGANPELQYTILKHLELILPLPSAEGVFDDEYRQFFVRYNEAPHIKHLKVDLLPLLANASNARDIIQELNEYVTDVDSQLSKRSLQAIGRIALNGTIGSELSGEIVTQMMRLAMDIDIPYVRSEAVYQCIYVLRIHRQTAHIVIPHIHKLLESGFIEDVKCRSAVIWMIGEYASDIDTSPYLLETIVDDYEEEASNELKLHLLTAVMKTFFARPPETRRTLGKLLKLAVNDMNDMDVHDRGLLYYRLLSSTQDASEDISAGSDIDMDSIAKIFRENTPISEYNDLQSEKKNDILTKEFNTLAVIYGEHSVIFIEDEYQLKLENAPMKDDTFENLLSPTAGGSNNSGNSAVAANAQGSVNLLDDSIDDGQDLLGDDTNIDNNMRGSASSAVGSFPFEVVQEGITTLSPPEFQKKYGAGAALHNGAIATMNSPDIERIVTTLKNAGLHVVASGNLPASGPAGFKLFAHILYQIGDGGLSLLSTDDEQKRASLLVQLVIVKSTGQVTGAVKVAADHSQAVSDTELATLLEHFLATVRQALTDYI